MYQDNTSNNKRLAKNTVLLYFRTIVIMLINLYTSRVILAVLGVEDYGIYNAVGGVVAMFTVISGALSGSISRYITYELGKGVTKQLELVFSTSVNIMIGLSLIILLLSEPICLWFLNTQMNIPDGRMSAANWVLQCSLFAFCINLVSVPYNSAIIAHEKMSAFAYISILEAVLRLAIVFLLVILPLDYLVSYSILILAVALIVRITYGVYCNNNFQECHYVFLYNKKLTREMMSFAGWSFLTNTAYIFNTHGVNLLTNLYFGVTMNAARGIATQVDNAVMQFVNNFTTALTPQITKSYAKGDTQGTFNLVCMGAKFSFFLMLYFALPLIVEADYLLALWLGGNVPPSTAIFVRLGIIAAIIDRFGAVMTTACMATGSIKTYTIYVSLAGSLAFILSWLFFKIGFSAESAYFAFIITYVVVNYVRLRMMKSMLNFPPMMFMREVLLKILPTLAVSFVAPLLIIYYVNPSINRIFLSFLCCTLLTSVSIYYLGMRNSERTAVLKLLREKVKKWK